nr:MAG TPA: Protein of unknown function (DUF2634) [Caudoviricetes sp.]
MQRLIENILLPDANGQQIANTATYTEPSLTYNIAYGNDGQIRGCCDELAAMRQAIYKIINTERYTYLIYSWDYGIELADLFGQPIPYVYAELQRRITEALLNDDRITKVYGFEFSNKREDVLAVFNVDTIYGTITGVQKELIA